MKTLTVSEILLDLYPWSSAHLKFDLSAFQQQKCQRFVSELLSGLFFYPTALDTLLKP